MNTAENTLAEMERQMSELVTQRRAIINRAQREIREANKHFDQEAAPLGRKINQLKEQLRPAEEAKVVQRTGQKRQTHDLEGLTDEEVEYYNELQRKKG